MRGCDAVIHLAGMNRGDERDIYRTNLRLTDELIEACRRNGSRPHVLLADSTHRDRESAYGRSKRESADKLREWASGNGARFTDFIIPNVFGEHGKPFYNSVVATFCHQLANGEESEVIEDSELELVHAQDAVRLMVEAIECPGEAEVRVSGTFIKVSAMLARLNELHGQYTNMIVPSLQDPLDLALFNTLRSYLYPRIYPLSPQLFQDQRGVLFEALRSRHGGQCFISKTLPGATRGNHYHLHKFERFMVLKGRASVSIRRLFSEEVDDFVLDGETPQCIDIPTLHSHSLENTGDEEVVTLFWSHQLYDPEESDTYAEEVRGA